jgi:4a-hydroxytetrahydrobiopterin dehydratase
MTTYNEQTVNSVLLKLKAWEFENNAIVKHFKFDTFSQAMGFLVQVGLEAEKQNHHPELFNVYNKLTIRLTTHDANGITKKDIDLAKAIDSIK